MNTFGPSGSHSNKTGVRFSPSPHMKTQHFTDEQRQRLPKYAQSYIKFLENQVESLSNDPTRVKSLYDRESTPAPEATLLLYGSNGVNEMDLGNTPSVRFRPNPHNPNEYITLRITGNNRLSVMGSSSKGIDIHPVSGNYVYVGLTK